MSVNAVRSQILLDAMSTMLNSEQDLPCWKPLHEAVFALDREQCTRLVVENPLSVHDRAANGDTALHIAAALGRADICTLLLINSAIVDATNQFGATPLRMAVCAGEIKTCKVLLKYHADPNHKDNEGWTPLKEAREIGSHDIALLLASATLEHLQRDAREVGINRLLDDDDQPSYDGDVGLAIVSVVLSESDGSKPGQAFRERIPSRSS